MEGGLYGNLSLGIGGGRQRIVAEHDHLYSFKGWRGRVREVESVRDEIVLAESSSYLPRSFSDSTY